MADVDADDIAAADTLLSRMKSACESESPEVQAEAAACTQHTALRYHRARPASSEKAFEMLLHSIRWRAETRPQSIRCPKCAVDPLSHNLRCVGFDAALRPIMYTCFSQAHDRFSPSANLAHVTWLLESVQDFLDRTGNPLCKWTLIVDYDGYALGDNNPKTAQNTIALLASHYPERLHLAVMYGAPWLFGAMWTAICAVADEKTTAKVKFVAHNGAAVEALTPLLGAETAAWVEREAAQNREARDEPKRYWEAPAADAAHDPRGTPAWLAHPERPLSHAELA